LALPSKYVTGAGCQWLTIVIPVTQKAEIREDLGSKSARANSSRDPISYLEKTHHRKGLVE
jgi:hypothetical protein